MIAVDLGREIFVPTAVALIGALVAGISAVVKSWFENRDARRRAERQLELADKRTKFVSQWVGISDELDDDDEAKAAARERARAELDEAYNEAQLAFNQAKNDASTVFRQFRRLLMLVRRRNPVSYVVSGLFLFVTTFVWLLLCIPDPGDDSFSIVAAILLSLATTIVLRAVAELVIGLFERLSMSDGQTITDLAVRSNVVTVTTQASHGLAENQPVVVDASNDVFDGTFTVTSVPDSTTFTFEHRAADVKSANVTGWVCGDTFKSQMRHLLMTDGGRPRSVQVVSGLFLVSLLAFSMFAVVTATDDLDADAYPQCYGAPYDGTYFGITDLDRFLDDEGELDVDAAVEFLQDQVPLWSPDYSGITIAQRIRSDADRDVESWLLVDDRGDEYGLDEYGLYFADGGSVLYAKSADDRLREIGDPCDPQQLTVHTPADAPSDRDGPLLFVYFDDSGDEADAGLVGLYEGQGDDEVKIEAYFGRDGRLIPVCSAENPEIEPCIARDNVYFDSGLENTVSRLFAVGLQIIVFAIAARLLFGLIARGLDRFASRRSRTGASGASTGSPPPPLPPPS